MGRRSRIEREERDGIKRRGRGAVKKDIEMESRMRLFRTMSTQIAALRAPTHGTFFASFFTNSLILHTFGFRREEII
jgi:hypothetical protein